ncbi:MAG: hypothetical protein L6Q55_10155 [Azonexus sp.]|nr:hypothetical protein [Azonexus sp.]MCK6412769.1 hypothetical protein [Azonexus sp.]
MSQTMKASADANTSWLRRFWLIIAATLLLAIASIFLVTGQESGKTKEIVHVPISVQATAANGMPISGKLALLIERRQEDELRRWEQKLQHVAASEISEQFEEGRTPDLVQIRSVLFQSFNQALPKRLQLRDLLIEDFFRVSR